MRFKPKSDQAFIAWIEGVCEVEFPGALRLGGPGLKPVLVVEFIRGLKPPANPKSTKAKDRQEQREGRSRSRTE